MVHIVQPEHEITSHVPDSLKPILTSQPGLQLLQESDVRMWIDRMPDLHKTELDDLYANIFYSTGVPFALADCCAVKIFFKKIRPFWNPPSAYRISNSHLNKAFKVFVNCREKFTSDCNQICLVTDGWSNLNVEHLVNFVTVFPNTTIKPILLKPKTIQRKYKRVRALLLILKQ